MKAWLTLLLAVVLSVSASLALAEEWNVVEGEGGGVIAKVRLAAPRLLTDRVVEETEFWVGCDSTSELYAGLVVPFVDLESGRGADTANLLLRYSSAGVPVTAVSQSTRVKLPYHWGFMLDAAQVPGILDSLLLAEKAVAGTLPSGADPLKATAQNTLDFSVNRDAVRLVVDYCAGERPSWLGGKWTYSETDESELIAASPNDMMNMYCKNAELSATLIVAGGDLQGIESERVSGISISLLGSPSPELLLPGDAIQIDADRYVVLTSRGEIDGLLGDFRRLVEHGPAIIVGLTLTGTSDVIASAPMATAGADHALLDVLVGCQTPEPEVGPDQAPSPEPAVEEGRWTVHNDGKLAWAATRSEDAELRFVCELEYNTLLMELVSEREIPLPYSALPNVQMALLADDVIKTYIEPKIPLGTQFIGIVVDTWMREASDAQRTIAFGITEDMRANTVNLFELGEFSARGSTAAIKTVQDACQ